MDRQEPRRHLVRHDEEDVRVLAHGGLRSLLGWDEPSSVFPVRQIVLLLAKMVASLSKELDNKTTEDDLLDLISERELQYAKMSSLLGKNQDDQQSASSAASRTIIEAVGRPKHAFLAM